MKYESLISGSTLYGGVTHVGLGEPQLRQAGTGDRIGIPICMSDLTIKDPVEGIQTFPRKLLCRRCETLLLRDVAETVAPYMPTLEPIEAVRMLARLVEEGVLQSIPQRFQTSLRVLRHPESEMGA